MGDERVEYKTAISSSAFAPARDASSAPPATHVVLASIIATFSLPTAMVETHGVSHSSLTAGDTSTLGACSVLFLLLLSRCCSCSLCFVSLLSSSSSVFDGEGMVPDPSHGNHQVLVKNQLVLTLSLTNKEKLEEQAENDQPHGAIVALVTTATQCGTFWLRQKEFEIFTDIGCDWL